MYDPLAYPIIHIFGESGWQYKMCPKRKKDILINQNSSINGFPLINFNNQSNVNYNNLGISNNIEPIDPISSDTNGKTSLTKYITAREYYSYRLQDRPSNIRIIIILKYLAILYP